MRERALENANLRENVRRVFWRNTLLVDGGDIDVFDAHNKRVDSSAMYKPGWLVEFKGGHFLLPRET